MAVSIVVPVRNEAENVAPLIAEITAALDGRWVYEIIYVNDGSTDGTADKLAAIMQQRSNLRQLRHAVSSGQSAAVRSGVRAARGEIVATLDGDGQNNPAFLPDLIAAIENGGMSAVTTELAPITDRSPIVTPLVITAWAPHQTLSPMRVGPFVVKPCQGTGL